MIMNTIKCFKRTNKDNTYYKYIQKTKKNYDFGNRYHFSRIEFRFAVFTLLKKKKPRRFENNLFTSCHNDIHRG